MPTDNAPNPKAVRLQILYKAFALYILLHFVLTLEGFILRFVGGGASITLEERLIIAVLVVGLVELAWYLRAYNRVFAGPEPAKRFWYLLNWAFERDFRPSPLTKVVFAIAAFDALLTAQWWVLAVLGFLLLNYRAYWQDVRPT